MVESGVVLLASHFWEMRSTNAIVEVAHIFAVSRNVLALSCYQGRQRVMLFAPTNTLF